MWNNASDRRNRRLVVATATHVRCPGSPSGRRSMSGCLRRRVDYYCWCCCGSCKANASSIMALGRLVLPGGTTKVPPYISICSFIEAKSRRTILGLGNAIARQLMFGFSLIKSEIAAMNSIMLYTLTCRTCRSKRRRYCTVSSLAFMLFFRQCDCLANEPDESIATTTLVLLTVATEVCLSPAISRGLDVFIDVLSVDFDKTILHYCSIPSFSVRQNRAERSAMSREPIAIRGYDPSLSLQNARSERQNRYVLPTCSKKYSMSRISPSLNAGLFTSS
jgi:hypothetical protein